MAGRVRRRIDVEIFFLFCITGKQESALRSVLCVFENHLYKIKYFIFCKTDCLSIIEDSQGKTNTVYQGEIPKNQSS